MITVTQNVGRLAEIRMAAPVSVDDLTLLQRDMSAILSRAQNRIVVCADLSGAQLFSDENAERMAKFFRGSSKLERSAIVVCGAATLYLQIERLLREGGGAPPPPPSRSEHGVVRDPSRAITRTTGELPTLKRPTTDPTLGKRPGTDPTLSKRMSERKAFRNTPEAMAWLDEVLTSEERARLRTFLEGPRSQK